MKCILLFVAVFVVGINGDYPSRFNSNEYYDILRVHNELRRREAYEEGVEFMAETEWDEDLQSRAQSHAACDLWEGVGYSENKAYLKDRHVDNVTDVYRQWYANKKHFNTKTNQCTGNPDDCAKYINIVKADSFKMGCGMYYCNSITNMENPPEKIFYLICIYEKFAKKISGGLFEAPYQRPKVPCMSCTINKRRYENGLCVKS